MEKINDLVLDGHNFNAHTAEGIDLIGKSITENGYGRSVVVDKNNNVIGGNGVVEASRKRGKGNTQIKVVETTGEELVVVRRTDIDIDTEEGRRLAMADNAVAELHWNTEELKYAEEKFGLKLDDWGGAIRGKREREESKGNGANIAIAV